MPTGSGARAGSCLSVGPCKLKRLEGLCVEAQSRWVAGQKNLLCGSDQSTVLFPKRMDTRSSGVTGALGVKKQGSGGGLLR